MKNFITGIFVNALLVSAASATVDWEAVKKDFYLDTDAQKVTLQAAGKEFTKSVLDLCHDVDANGEQVVKTLKSERVCTSERIDYSQGGTAHWPRICTSYETVRPEAKVIGSERVCDSYEYRRNEQGYFVKTCTGHSTVSSELPLVHDVTITRYLRGKGHYERHQYISGSWKETFEIPSCL